MAPWCFIWSKAVYWCPTFMEAFIHCQQLHFFLRSYTQVEICKLINYIQHLFQKGIRLFLVKMKI